MKIDLIESAGFDDPVDLLRDKMKVELQLPAGQGLAERLVDPAGWTSPKPASFLLLVGQMDLQTAD